MGAGLVALMRCLVAAGGIHGTVRAAEDSRSIAGVSIEIDGAVRAISDSLGHYEARDLAPGRQAVRFVAAGYEPRELTVLLADSTDLELDVQLTAHPVILPSIEVSARAIADATVSIADNAPPEPGRVRLEPDWRNDMMAGRADVERAMLTVPGIAGRGEDGGAVSIRGGGGAENLVLLDGIPVFSGVHFGTASSALNPDAIAGLDLHLGVSSARFGGRLSGVAELETGELAPNSGRTMGAVGPTDVRSVVRGRLSGGSSFLLAGRLSFRDPLSQGRETDNRDGYGDLLGVGRMRLGSGDLRLIAFHSASHLALESTVDSLSEPDATAALAEGNPPIGGNRLGWRSHSDGATWTATDPRGQQLRLAAWWAGTESDIDWRDGGSSKRLSSGLEELGVSGDLTRPYRNGTALVGFSLTRPRTHYSVSGLSLSAAPALGSLFVEWSWRPLGRLGLRAGLRGDTDFQTSWNVEPRLSLSVEAGGATRLGIGVGRTHQAIQSLLNDENILGTILGLELPVATGPGVRTASADQIELGIEHRLFPHVTLSASGYLRRWSDVALPAASTRGLFVSDTIAYGRGNAAGATAGVALEEGLLSLRASVALARTVRSVGATEYHAGFERPWSISSDASYRVAPRTVLQLGFSASAGQPSSLLSPGFEWRPFRPLGGGELEGTPNTIAGPIGAVRLPGYLRLDLGARRSWSLRGIGSRGAISTALRIDNVLNRANDMGFVAGPTVPRALLGLGRAATFEVGWTF
jgi:hypothetical protein